jgi:hypothetical protein
MQPVSNAKYRLERNPAMAIRSGGQRRSPAYRHGNCPVRHRSVDGEMITFPANKFAARMPDVGEELRGFGYPRTGMSGSAPINTAVIIAYERRFVISTGQVVERHPIRRDRSGVPYPAVMTHAHDEHGMSGGPVVDGDGVIIGVIARGMRPDSDGGDWVSYTCLIGPALQLTGLLPLLDGSEDVVRMGQLVVDEVIEFDIYDSLDVVEGLQGVEVRYRLNEEDSTEGYS